MQQIDPTIQSIIIGNKQRTHRSMARQVCIKCRTIPANVLVLECNHPLCMTCAAKICKVDSQSIGCPACRVSTYLDEDIISQIYQFSHAGGQDIYRGLEETGFNSSGWRNINGEHIGSEDIGKSTKKLQRERDREREVDHSRIHKKKTIKSLYSEATEQPRVDKTILNCKDHNEYEIMYICLDCQSMFVCPQCVIHGNHKNHQVQTIKKTVTKIEAEISSKIYSLDCSIEGLMQASDIRNRNLRQRIEHINQLKMEAVSKYKSIRQEIAREEADVITRCEALIQDFQQDYMQVQAWIKNDLNVIEKERDIITGILAYQGKDKLGKRETRIAEMRVVEDYLQLLKKDDKSKNKKLLWLHNKQNLQIQPQTQQTLQILTDRIQRIQNNQSFLQQNRGKNQNDIMTKGNSLANSRTKMSNRLEQYPIQVQVNANENKQPNRQRYWESPFNNLKMSADKENTIPETESILVKNSQIRDSNKMRKKSLKSQEENNFLIF